VYRVTVAKTGSLLDKSVLLTVTGENATADPVVYDVQLQRGDAPIPGNRPATGAPAISGTARVGMTLDAVSGTIADPDGVPAMSTWTYQWIRVHLNDDGAATGTETTISGATSAEYVVTGDDIGQRLAVVVSFRDNEGNLEENLRSAVHPAAPDVVMPPMVSLKLVDANGDMITEIDEDGGKATVTAELSGAHTAAVTVTVSTDPATGDFTVSTNKTLTIAAGDTESSGEVTITASQDDDAEDEEVTVKGALPASLTGAGWENPTDVDLTIIDDEVVPGVVRELSVRSSASATLDVSWLYPNPATVTSDVTGYKVLIRPGTGNGPAPAADDSRWQDPSSGGTAADRTHQETSLVNGQPYEVWVRSQSAAGPGMAKMESGTPWPAITGVATGTVGSDGTLTPATAIAENDLASTTAEKENETTLRVTLNASAVSAFNVKITATATVPDTDADADTDPDPVDVPVTFDGEVTVPLGTSTVDVKVTSPGNMTDNPTATVTFTAKLVPMATADRATPASSHQAELEVTDDDELAGAVGGPTAGTGAGSGEIVVTWTPPTGFGTLNGVALTAAGITGYEIRSAKGTDATAFTGDTGWMPAGNANARSMTLTGLDAGVDYAVQVRAVTAVGGGADGTAVTAEAGDS